MLGDRDREVVLYVARRGLITLRELEDWISSRWGVGRRAAWRVVRRLVRRRVLRYRRSRHTIWVELHPELLSLVAQIYGSYLTSFPDRVRYHERSASPGSTEPESESGA